MLGQTDVIELQKKYRKKWLKAERNLALSSYHVVVPQKTNDFIWDEDSILNRKNIIKEKIEEQ